MSVLFVRKSTGVHPPVELQADLTLLRCRQACMCYPKTC